MSTNALDDLLASVGSFMPEATPQNLIITAIVTALPLLALLGLAISQRDRRLPPPAGCRKIGLKGKSNLEDQYSKKYAGQIGEPGKAKPWTVKALFVYPIKSCAPVELDRSDVIRTGMKYDREFCFGQYVTGLPTLEGKVHSEWQFMTLRKFPRLATVETEIWVPDPSAQNYHEDGEWVKSEGCVVLRFPFSPDTDFTLEGLRNFGKVMAARLAGKPEPVVEFRIPFNPPKERVESKGYTSDVLRIWRDNPLAFNVGSEIEPDILAKLRYTLGAANPISLFRINPEKRRQVFKNAPKKADVGFQTVIGMQDSYPMHVVNLASVHDVANKLSEKQNAKFTQAFQTSYVLHNALRYRANIYVTGPKAFEEDSWTKAKIGSTEYHFSCRTTRCKLPNVDPETGVADPNEPSTTLRSYRIIDPGSKNPVLGMQITPLEEGEVKVGDSVEALETGEHIFDGGEGDKVIG
ncbi:hypothetical protein ACN47E_006944 [Coniothyrium glycines]